MNSPILSFVALDLETTGLDPNIDTIIEIAAVRGDICFENNHFIVKNLEERTMLVHPECEISEEVTMITHITQNMLDGKPTWKAIKDRVRNFIPENAVIIGHNVIFDINMLVTHGIDLTKNPILDTFEFSEIFSQNAESLNLGFLADFYGIIKKGQEHRALTDVKISIDLAIQFLNILKNTDKNWRQIALGKHSVWNFLHIFFEDAHNIDIENILKNPIYTTKIEAQNTIKNSNNSHQAPEIISLKSDIFEIDHIKTEIANHHNIQIITTSKKRAFFLQSILESNQINSQVTLQKSDFLAADAIFKAIKNLENTERKYQIFLFKMIFWILTTQNGNVGNLKYYGEELAFLENFRLQETETNFWYENHKKNLENFTVIISPYQENNIHTNRKIWIRDIAQMEEYIRKNSEVSIDFEKIIATIRKYKTSNQQKIIEALRLTEAIYTEIPDRPQGENPTPPGKYGETYFFSQNDFWTKGCKWLCLSNSLLVSTFSDWKKEIKQFSSRETAIEIAKIIQKIQHIINFQQIKMPDFVIILQIINEKTLVKILPKCLSHSQKKFLNSHHAYGFHLEATGIDDFLEKEIHILYKKNIQISRPQITKFQGFRFENLKKKTVILTTSMKHIRELGNALKRENITILMQGISGGKSKMKHYFLKNPDETVILIGLIDSWADESNFFEKTDTIIIAKIPFDPPTDIHFLAKTSGMPHSFEKYSKPIVLIRLNTLIGNAISANKNIQIICSDERIQKTEWGKYIEKNLL